MPGNASSQLSANQPHAVYSLRSDRDGTSRSRQPRKARIVWYAAVPSAFVITFVGLLWLDMGSQFAGSITAAQPAVATTTHDFLHAPAGDPSLPRASDMLIPSADAETSMVPTF